MDEIFEMALLGDPRVVPREGEAAEPAHSPAPDRQAAKEA